MNPLKVTFIPLISSSKVICFSYILSWYKESFSLSLIILIISSKSLHTLFINNKLPLVKSKGLFFKKLFLISSILKLSSSCFDNISWVRVPKYDEKVSLKGSSFKICSR